MKNKFLASLLMAITIITSTIPTYASSNSVSVKYNLNDDEIAALGYDLMVSMSDKIPLQKDDDFMVGTSSVSVAGLISTDEFVTVSFDSGTDLTVADPSGRYTYEAAISLSDVTGTSFTDGVISESELSPEDICNTLFSKKNIEGYEAVNVPISILLDADQHFRYKGTYKGNVIININKEEVAQCFPVPPEEIFGGTPLAPHPWAPHQ